MRSSSRRALSAVAGLALGVIGYLVTVAFWPVAGVTVVAWPGGPEDPGGWSGIEVAADGRRFWAIHDNAGFAEGTLLRDGAERLTGARLETVGRLADPQGVPIVPAFHDSEGLALDAQGRFAVSFEWQHRVWRYGRLGGPAEALDPDPRFAPFTANAGLEAVAVTRDGTLLTFRERSGLVRGPMATYLRPPDGPWRDGPSLPKPDLWSAVGADIGPDGALYLLERRFRGLGFASRIRRLDLSAEDPAATATVLYTAPIGRHGNLEGLAVWADATGRLRAVLVSDNNRLPIQRGQIVEVVLPLALSGPPA